VSHTIDELYGCHIWQGTKDRFGYGVKGKRSAHKVIWEELNGPVPEGKTLDHLCRRTSCVNPEHLELCSQAENNRRKSWRYRVKRKQCSNGHSLKRYGLRTPEGGILCRRCHA